MDVSDSARIAVPGANLTISFPFSLIDSLNAAIAEFARRSQIRHAEMGGVLRIERQQDTLYIHDATAIAGRAGQASWTLDAAEADALHDPAMGFFRTHTRKALSLSRDDLELCDRHSPALFCLIRPFTTRPNQCAIFFEERFDPETTPNVEFALDRAALGGSQQAELSAPLSVARRIAVPQPAPQPVAPPPPRDNTARNWMLLMAGAVGLGAGGGLWLHRQIPAGAGFGTQQQTLRSGSRLAFAATPEGSLVTLKWDTNSPVVMRATGATLWISDEGNPTTHDLTEAQIHTGLFVLPAKGQHLLLRLTVRSDREQVAESLAVDLPAPDAPPPA